MIFVRAAIGSCYTHSWAISSHLFSSTRVMIATVDWVSSKALLCVRLFISSLFTTVLRSREFYCLWKSETLEKKSGWPRTRNLGIFVSLFFLALPWGMWDLSSSARSQTYVPLLEACYWSLNQYLQGRPKRDRVLVLDFSQPVFIFPCYLHAGLLCFLLKPSTASFQDILKPLVLKRAWWMLKSQL